MALVLANRVQETGTANTTVSFTLSGAVAGFQTFAAVGNTNTTYYAATDTSGNWEVGLGTYATSGPTLTRTTVYASSNSGSAVTFSGTVNVFVTYPSGRSVNLDASGNVSALGTIASGVWNGTTIPVAYGGTGVTASSGANSVMLRDANQNVSINRLNQTTTTVTAAGGTTTLTAASTFSWVLVGTGGQTFKLPDATTLTDTTTFEFNNNATGTLTLIDNASGAVGTVASGGAAAIALLSNSTVAGTWDVHAYIPENVQWGTNSLALGSTVISGGTWQGGTIQSGYGGTGLTTFTGANNALYSTSSSALAAGTLPVAAGGTGVTSSTGSGANVLATSPTLVTPVLGTPSSGTLTSCTGLPLTTGVTGTLGTANGGTGNINGTVATLTTARAIYGNNFDGSAALTQIIASTYGGTGNGFTKFSGPTTAERTFTLPDATATILTNNAAVTVAQGGTGAASQTAYAVLCGGTTSTSAYQSIAGVGTTGQVLTSNGAGALPTFQTAGGGFASGTKMLFVQTAAPTGWTKDTTNNNNSAIRIVTGTASTGGTVAFTTAFASQGVSGSLSTTTATNQSTTATNASFTPAGTISVTGSTGAYTLATNEIPSHYHIAAQANDGGVTARYGVTTGLASTRIDYDNSNFQGTQGGNSSNTGGGGSHSHSFSGSGSFSGTAATPTQNAHTHTQDGHTHTFTGTAINLAVQYVDVIVATKD